MSVSTPILTTLLDKKGSIWAEAVAVSAKAPVKPRITASLIGNSFRVALTPRDSRATFRSCEQYPRLLISLRRVGPTLPIPAFRRSWRAPAFESLGSMHVGNVSRANLRAFSPHARAKKLARAAECLVYSLTPSGVLAENHPKNRGFVGILRGQKCLKRRFSRRSPVGEWSRGARSMPRVFGRGSRSQPAALVTGGMSSERPLILPLICGNG